MVTVRMSAILAVKLVLTNDMHIICCSASTSTVQMQLSVDHFCRTY